MNGEHSPFQHFLTPKTTRLERILAMIKPSKRPSPPSLSHPYPSSCRSPSLFCLRSRPLSFLSVSFLLPPSSLFSRLTSRCRSLPRVQLFTPLHPSVFSVSDYAPGPVPAHRSRFIITNLLSFRTVVVFTLLFDSHVASFCLVAHNL